MVWLLQALQKTLQRLWRKMVLDSQDVASSTRNGFLCLQDPAAFPDMELQMGSVAGGIDLNWQATGPG